MFLSWVLHTRVPFVELAATITIPERTYFGDRIEFLETFRKLKDKEDEVNVNLRNQMAKRMNYVDNCL